MAKQHPLKPAAEELPAERQKVLHPYRATGRIKAVFKTREELNDWEQEQKSIEMYRVKYNALEGLYLIGSVSDTFNNRLSSLYRNMMVNYPDVLPDHKQHIYNNALQNWEHLSTDDMLNTIKCLIEEISSPVNLSPAGNNFFTDFCIKDQLRKQLSLFLIYLKKQSYIDFNEKDINTSDFKIAYQKNSSSVFAIAFFRFLNEKFTNEEIEAPWSMMSKYFTDKTGTPLKNKQLSNKNNEDEKQDSIEKQFELIENLYEDFEAENE